jgi:pumilio RNA-binding family
LQQDFPRTPSPVYNQIRSSSRLANEEVVDGVSVSDPVMPSTAATELSSAPSGMPSTLSSYIPSHNPSGGQAIGTIASGSSLKLPGLIASISASEPLSMVIDIPENLAEFKGPPNSRMTHLHGSSLLDDKDAAGTSNLATVFQGLNFSSTDSQESVGLSLNPQHLLEMSYQEPHSKMSQHIHLHSQHSRSAQGQSQSAHREAFPHALQSEQQILGLEPSSTMQSKLGLSSHSPSNNGASKNVYTAAAMSHLSDSQYFPNLQTPNMYGSPYRMTGCSMNSTDNIAKCASSAAFENTPAGLAGWSLASGTDMYQLYKNMSQGGTLSESWLSDPVYQHYLQQKHAVNGGHNSLSTLSQSRLSDHVYLQYLQQQAADDGHGSISTGDPGMLREYLAAAQIDRLESQKSKKTPIVGYPSEFRSCAARDSHGMQIANKIGLVSPKCYDSSPLFANSALSSPDSLRLSNRGAAAGIYGGWQGQRSADISGDLKCSSLLEELKNCKTRRFELDDIAGHVVEFR